MNRNKLLLSILIMVGLVTIGIILPTIWKKEHNKSPTTNNKPDVQTQVSKEEITEVVLIEPNFLDFEQLKVLFSTEKIHLLKEQFPAYLTQVGKNNINSVRFLSEATTYPQDSSILLQFVLSDSSILPITYSTREGAFFFGKEQIPINEEVEN